MDTLSPLEQDAIAELLNIGMGRAASSLSEMVDEEVLLSVPQVDILSRREASEVMTAEDNQAVSAVRQEFSGPFWGDALLLFPEDKSLELVRCLIKEDLPLEVLTDLEQEALVEVGNIILNACLGSLADLFKKPVTTEIPEYLQSSIEDILHISGGDSDNSSDAVMFLHMDFSVEQLDLQGYVAFLMDIRSMDSFKQHVAQFIGYVA